MASVKSEPNLIPANSRNNRGVLYLIGGFLLCLSVLFYETVWSIVSIWIRSETFAHGFLVIPIVAWMIWGRRFKLREIDVAPEFRALVLLAGAGFLWLLAYLVDVLVIQQFALVIMIVSSLWVILGNRICWAIAFPLAYLLFLVPVGEGLVPAMMEFTATFTVAMVKFTGIPVYREGLFFYLPSGNWSVVEACSGVRYLIASVTLGSLYAYLTYSRIWKRFVFIVISFIVPVIANGLRAYIIVMLGHWSDMTIATGVDHLIYGWLFFGLVMFILFAIGNFWRDDEMDVRSTSNAAVQENFVSATQKKISFVSLFKVSLLSLAVAAVWPLLAYTMEQRQSVVEGDSLHFPEQLSNWRRQPMGSDWYPENGGVSRVDHQGYGHKNSVVELVLHHYLQQSQGSELVSGKELLLPDDEERWRVLSRGRSVVILTSMNLSVKQAILKDRSGAELLVWSWYRVGDRFVANDYQAKVFEALSKLTFGRQDSARFFLASPILSGPQGRSEAEQVMSAFLESTLIEVTEQLDQSVGLD